MELNHLRYFYEVAKQGSFTKASKSLRVSQPSISKIVKQLEQREDVKLFDRNRRGVILTSTGKLFYDRCLSIFTEVSRLKTIAASQKEEVSGELSIGASDNLCNYVYPRLIESFWKLYPKVNIKLFNGNSGSIKTEVTDGRAELGVFFTRVNDKSLDVERIGFCEFVIACSPNNEIIRSNGFTLKGLEELYFLGCWHSDYQKTYPTMQMLNSLGLKPKIFFESNSQETQKRMAMRAWGYTVVPRYMIEKELRDNELKIIKTPKKIGSDVFLVKRKNRTLSRAAEVFETYLKRELPKLLT